MNNRQNGRRRGRGGQQARNGQPGNVDRGNRIDNRARGNAAQLLEKYKNLARDAQMQGDRVNTEYYLQFADHYFRVLSESRARFEEQRQQEPRNNRRDDYRDEFGGDGDYEAEGQRYDQSDANWGDGDGDAPQAQPERNGADRGQNERSQNGGRQPRSEEQPAAAEASEGGERRPRRQRERRANGANGANGSNGHAEAREDEASERIEIDRLPQSLSVSQAPVAADDGDEIEVAPRPRRRAPRRPRAEESTVDA